jgi:hypothetical protein
VSLPLPLRNRLAELILDAFDRSEPRATLAALARGLAADEASLGEEDAARLLALGWFEAAGPGQVRLRGAHRGQRARLAERAGRAASLVGEWNDAPGDLLVRLLGRAAGLADHGLFFEVHELLEPAWFRAEEPLRSALQGLIQVAVAFHHLAHRNHEGARSLLAEGIAKLEAAGGVLPVEVGDWLAGLRGVLATLSAGGAPATVPGWPRPATLQWAPGRGRPAAAIPGSGRQPPPEA